MKNKRRGLNNKKYWGVGLLFVCVILVVIFVSGSSEKPIPHLNLVDTQISQYSDKNITPNAIATNPEFKNIAFEAVPTKSYIFQSQIAAVINAIKSLIPQTENKNNPKEYGSWVWTPIMEMSPEYMESILSGTKADGVNTIYLSIDTYLDVFVMPKGAERENQKKIFSDKLENFIISANKKGIAVDAEAGWRNWAEEGNEYKGFAIVNYVKNFNATHQSKFRGFQYDVEPYLLDSYAKNEKSQISALANFIKLVDQTQNFISTSTLKFSVVIPDFYDEKDAMTLKFSYNGNKGYTFKHLLNILDKRPDSSVIIMSYRNFADGSDGTIGISKNEMQTAKNGGYDTKIIIAQETGDVPPPYITFYSTPKKYFEEQTGKINTAFNSYSNFGGLAVHYVNAFLALK